MEIEKEIKSTVPLSITKKVILNLNFTKNMIADKFQEILKPFDLSSEQYNVLRILRGQKGKPVNMSDIQERMLTKNSNTTRLIDKLITKEMVIRNVCPNNRRKMEITITDVGLKALANLDLPVENYEQSITGNLTAKELETLNTLLEKIKQ